MLPSGSAMSTLMLRLRLSTGTRSVSGVSHQSISPFCSAAEAVAGIRHDDPLDAVEADPLAAGQPDAGSLRGT